MDTFVHGLFHDEHDAASAVEALCNAHFKRDEISAILRVGAETTESEAVFNMPVGRGAALGASLGAVGGALLAVSGFLVAGPLAAIVAGAMTGTLAGGLGGMGQWSTEVDLSGHHPEGMILVGVSTDDAGVERARAAIATARPERIHVSKKGAACEEVEAERPAA
jgi:hypothetical protein